MPSPSNLIREGMGAQLKGRAKEKMEEEKCPQHVYMQCMKNQSANFGTYTIDGCGEFIPDGSGFFCTACSCHRSFHRKVPASSYISSELPLAQTAQAASIENQAMEKQRRARTKFTVDQKKKMGSFAEKIGWRISKRERGDEEEVERFLEETEVSRRAFKVWMHNHRNAGHAQATADSSGTETDESAPAITAGVINNVDAEVEAYEHNNARVY